MAMAVFALADVLAEEKVSTWIREPLVVESIDHKGPGCRRARVFARRSVRCSPAPAVSGFRLLAEQINRAIVETDVARREDDVLAHELTNLRVTAFNPQVELDEIVGSDLDDRVRGWPEPAKHLEQLRFG
jgi:hypothetical protein